MSVTCTVANQFHFVYRTTTATPRRSDASTRRLTICRRSRGAPIPGGCSPNGTDWAASQGSRIRSGRQGVKERGRHSSTLSLAGDVEGITRPQVTRPTSVFSLAHRITSVLDPSQRDRPQCSSLLHNRMEPLQTAPRVGLDFCAPRVCKPVEIRAHVEYPLMRVHADSSPSGVQWLWPCSTFRENATLDATSTAVGSSKVTHSRRQACSVGRRREAGPVRTTLQQSSMDVNPPATLCCATHDELQPPTVGQDDLSVRLPGGWHGFSFPSWLPCRAPSSLSMKPHSRPSNPLHPPITLKQCAVHQPILRTDAEAGHARTGTKYRRNLHPGKV
ncbi:hypothetical protein BGZ61DRAFT_113949 [Ilyonectria robusta]|uniref:uncharacterized protein n=1 Tax=Ilyonectria robusta TaxID=1079257 RepID=UPI001E8D747D|nr:uncharacterized protein BGZ61DRAFT_113949 [Ilyonectria robusta]KAH8670026.1 hypothetical protein BGZ61DRAFT_113949 [Ilyonectria robusta]